jgi:DNA replicative helicase MCM subunit Mcm2 (Cdc46/Mcm family)
MEEMDDLQRDLEETYAALRAEQRERFSPILEEIREATAALRLSETVREDAREAIELARRLSGQAAEDQERAREHVRRVAELLRQDLRQDE